MPAPTLRSPPPAPPRFIEHIVDVDGRRLSVRLCASAPGAVDALFLHGIPGSARSWDRVLPLLPPGVRAFVPDLLGFGGSDRAAAFDDLHAEGQAALLEGMLERLGVRRPLLVGHDFGGPVALRMLLRAGGAHPERYAGLVLAATNAFGDAPIPFPLSLVNAPVVGPLAARVLFAPFALTGMCRFGARRGRVDAAGAVGDARQAGAIRTIFAGSLRDLPGLYGPIERFLPRIALPAVVLWGDRDPFFPLAAGERTAAAVPGARFVRLDGVGHFVPDEAPERVAAAVGELAGRVVAARG